MPESADRLTGHEGALSRSEWREGQLCERLERRLRRAWCQPVAAGLAGLATEARECLSGSRVEIALRDPQAGPADVSDAFEGSLEVPVIVRGRGVAVVGIRRQAGAGSADAAARCAVLIAAAAATLIDRAQSAVETTRRDRWYDGAVSLARELVAGHYPSPLGRVAQRTAEVAEADAVCIVQPAADGATMIVTAAAGDPPTELGMGSTLDDDEAVPAAVMASGKGVSLAHWDAREHFGADTTRPRLGRTPPAAEHQPVSGLDAALVVALTGIDTRGVLIIGRGSQRPAFTAGELGAAMVFARQIELALELAESRTRRETLLVMEERERISHELRDDVIQRLFAVGMSLQRAASGLTGPAAYRVQDSIEGIDDTIIQIRSTIHHLTGQRRRSRG